MLLAMQPWQCFIEMFCCKNHIQNKPNILCIFLVRKLKIQKTQNFISPLEYHWTVNETMETESVLRKYAYKRDFPCINALYIWTHVLETFGKCSWALSISLADRSRLGDSAELPAYGSLSGHLLHYLPPVLGTQAAGTPWGFLRVPIWPDTNTTHCP